MVRSRLCTQHEPSVYSFRIDETFESICQIYSSEECKLKQHTTKNGQFGTLITLNNVVNGVIDGGGINTQPLDIV